MGATPSNVHVLLLALSSVITPGSALRALWNTQNGTLGDHLQGKCPIHRTIALAPSAIEILIITFTVSSSFIFEMENRHHLPRAPHKWQKL